METVALHGPRLGVAHLCAALALPRATYYRHLEAETPAARPTPARALSASERRDVLAVLHEPRFVDLAPGEVHARLLDEGRYLCSERTMYRVLAENAEVRERRDQLRHPEYKKPELLARAPNQVWSWDITKLLGPQKWTYFYLYVLIDIFSRTSSAGCSPTARAPRWRASSSVNRASGRRSSLASSSFTRTGARR